MCFITLFFFSSFPPFSFPFSGPPSNSSLFSVWTKKLPPPQGGGKWPEYISLSRYEVSQDNKQDSLSPNLLLLEFRVDVDVVGLPEIGVDDGLGHAAARGLGTGQGLQIFFMTLTIT